MERRINSVMRCHSGSGTYEILWCENHVDIRELPDAIGFAVPFLVGTPGEAKVLGVFPAKMGRGYARQLEKSMTGLGLFGAISFYVADVHRVSTNTSYVHVLEKEGRPVGVSQSPVHFVDADIRTHRCEIGRMYYEGVGK